MSLYYSPSTKGFYHEDFHAEEIFGCNIPVDAVEISEAYHTQLFDGVAAGRQIVNDDKGYPVLQDTVYPFDELKDITKHIITDQYNQEIISPVEFKSVDGTTNFYQASTAGLASLQSWITTGMVPTGFYWKAVDNTQTPFSIEDCKGLSFAILNRNFQSFQKLQDLKDKLLNATTEEDVKKIIW